jgi:hypothetical protein
MGLLVTEYQVTLLDVGSLCDKRGVEVTEGFPFFVNKIGFGWFLGHLLSAWICIVLQ